MRRELGHEYVESLRSLFAGRLPGSSDFVCYWFEKTRATIEAGRTKRAGLIATNSIAGGNNVAVLERIKDSGGIFVAWRDEPWVLDGAAVRVSIVCFDDGMDERRILDGTPVPDITSRLTVGVDLREARPLEENAGLGFIGIQKGGDFNLSEEVAQRWLPLSNPSGVDNADVLRPIVGGRDLTGKRSNTWLIDFAQMTEEEAARYVVPFDHAERNVKPVRMKARRQAHKRYWWRHHDTRPALREAIATLDRYIVTPITSKHRFFVWQPSSVLANNAVAAIASDDDVVFGVLQSSTHELWALRLGTSLEDRPRYTPSTSFETFPFPRSDSDHRREIETWARHLDTTRTQLLESDESLTMTKLYNELDGLREQRDSAHRAYPLLVAHEKLDAAVAAAYGWEWPLEEDEILARLLALNLERAAGEEERAAAD